jgi:predicted TIM-barrel fold metal-dependent hydrolase
MSRPDIVEPELPIIDAHHHLWPDGVGGRFMVDDLVSDLASGHNVKATVYVECGSFYRADGPAELRPVGEVEFANGVAAMGASGQFGSARICASIVGHVNLLGPGVASTLECMVRAGNGRLKGIRHMAANHPEVKQEAPAGMLLEERFRQGYARLGEYGLSFDAWLYHPQLGELLPLAEAYPEIPVVINHAGGLVGMGSYADSREESFAEWRSALRALAALPHVHVKLGGFFMPAFGLGFERAEEIDYIELAVAAKPIIDTCIELFGPRRCMFESNFPVTRNFISYRDIWNAYKVALRGYSAYEKAYLLHDTAKNFYSVESKPRTFRMNGGSGPR